MHNVVYAFDANAPEGPIWQRELEPSIQLQDPEIGPEPKPPLNAGYKDIEWEVGIVSTPVIDTDRGAIYVVSTTKRSGSIYQHHLWKLDLTTGVNLQPPTLIAGSSGVAAFNSSKQIQRAGLLLANSSVYAAFASYGDNPPYRGWVFRFDADTLAISDVFCTVPAGGDKGGEGGIWQAGQGPAADDSGNVYVITGNGDFEPTESNFGMSVLKLDPTLRVLDWFAPHDQGPLSDHDLDLGSGGVLVIPGANRIAGGGKTSILCL
jgi:hypothetical protein